MRHAIFTTLVCTAAVGCANMKDSHTHSHPSPAHEMGHTQQPLTPQQAAAAQAAMQQPPAAAMGRTVTSLRDVQPGDRISVLQYVDKTETWVTGQVESLDEERLTMVQCAVEERNYEKKGGGPSHGMASRYSLPPDQVRAIRVP
jgi:hypothetical protein